MRDIAKAAGVSPGAAYRHFASQDELFFAVIEELFADLEIHLQEAASEAKGFRATAHKVAKAYVAWGLENPGGYQLIFEETDDLELLKAGRRPGLQIIDQIGSMLAPKFRLPKRAVSKVTLIWMALHGLVSLRIHKLGMPWKSTIDQDVDDLLKALLRP
jgi:AcrR family transcriptional regulator